MPSPPSDAWPRITDLSCFEAENFKVRNTQFLRRDEQPYRTGQGRSDRALRRRIWNVRNGDLRRVLEGFPKAEPVREQYALWMHAVVGKHFFPDANHRTAVAMLRTLLQENGIDYKPWSIERLRRARTDSHTFGRRSLRTSSRRYRIADCVGGRSPVGLKRALDAARTESTPPPTALPTADRAGTTDPGSPLRASRTHPLSDPLQNPYSRRR